MAHGATGKGNDQVRFELTYTALDPRLKIIAPWREWEIRSRQDAIEYARKRNVPVTATEKSIYSRDRNLWHLSHEGGPLEDPWMEPDESMFLLSASPENAPDEAEYVEIASETGLPVAVNGEAMSPAQLVSYLNALGGKHGIGRTDLVESRLVGMKSHGVYETPGGTILMAGHRELEAMVLDKDTLQFKDMVALKYAELVYNGMWFSPLRESLAAFVDSTQGPVTGEVRLKLYKGNIIPVGRKSVFSLYREDFATFGAGRRVRPDGRQGLHPPVRPAAQGARPERLARLGSEHAPARITPASSATDVRAQCVGPAKQLSSLNRS